MLALGEMLESVMGRQGDEAVRCSRVVDAEWSSGNVAGVGGRVRLGTTAGKIPAWVTRLSGGVVSGFCVRCLYTIVITGDHIC